jgi:hypothetical protein
MIARWASTIRIHRAEVRWRSSQGDREKDRRPSPIPIARPDPPTVGLDDATADGKPQTDPSTISGMGSSVELLENSIQVSLG